MYFYLIGIDYKRAPIDIRDKIYRGRKAVSDFWEERDPHGSAVLVTCNRLEVYGATGYADDAIAHIRRFSESFPDFAKYAYIRYGEAEVFRHALRLASGLESQIKGEGQILVQLNRWRRDIPSHVLNDLWGKVMLLSQKIRMAAGLNKDSGNIASLVFSDIKSNLGFKTEYKVMIIGTGKIAELFARHCPPEARLYFAARKNYDKAEGLARKSGGKALLLKDLPGAIAGADVLIGATSSPHYVLDRGHFNEWKAGRKNSLYIYDLAIPRDVDPAIAALDGVVLQNLDDLGRKFYRYNESVRGRAELASGLIEDVLEVYRGEAVHDGDY